MRKEILYFDMQKIEENDEPLCESEQLVAQRCRFDPKPNLYLRLDLEAALERLTPRQRQVMELIAAGHTEEEIAKALGISHQSVSRLLKKAQRTLRKFLEGGAKQPQSAPNPMEG